MNYSQEEEGSAIGRRIGRGREGDKEAKEEDPVDLT